MASIYINASNVSAMVEGDDWEFYDESIPLNTNYNLQQTGYLPILITANDGYKITEVSADDGFENVGTFTISGDGKTARTTNILFSNSTHINVYVSVESINPPTNGNISGFNHLYLVDRNILKSLSNELFMSSGDPQDGSMVDLGEFIINILELPFSLPENIINDESFIRIGNKELTTKAHIINVDEIEIDLGNIYVPSKYHNSYDYMNTDINLHLPYLETISLNIEYVIGHTINIKYIVDLYSGDSTVNIISDKTGKVIHSQTFSIGRDIPFINNVNRRVNELSDNKGLNNGIDTPFIEVIRNLPPRENMFTGNITEQSVLSDYSGFVTVTNAILNTNASLEEKTKIMRLLREGVYIK